MLNIIIKAGVAQSVERLTCNEGVVGSSPSASFLDCKLSVIDNFKSFKGRWQSGQMHQAVNLAGENPTEVQILPCPYKYANLLRV